MRADTSLLLLRGSARGGRPYFEAPRNRGKNLTLLSGMRAEGLGPSLAVGALIIRELSEACVAGILLLKACSGQMVVLGQLPARKGGRVKEFLQGRGCKFSYLPACSPDLNSDWEAFSKVEGCCVRHSRPAAARC